MKNISWFRMQTIENLICLVHSIDYGFGFDDYITKTERNELMICFAPIAYRISRVSGLIFYSGVQYGKLAHSKLPVLNTAAMVHVTYHSSGIISVASRFPTTAIVTCCSYKFIYLNTVCTFLIQARPTLLTKYLHFILRIIIGIRLFRMQKAVVRKRMN